jgi:hypothetical protein
MICGEKDGRAHPFLTPIVGITPTAFGCVKDLPLSPSKSSSLTPAAGVENYR